MLFETMFTIGNVFVLPFWALMILAPRWHWTRRFMSSLWPVAIVAFAYVWLLGVQLSAGFSGPPQPTLTGLAQLFGTPEGTAIGWLHFLALDLFVGRWAYLDGQQRGISYWLLSLALLFVFMAGPLGLLLYLFIRLQFQRASSDHVPARDDA